MKKLLLSISLAVFLFAACSTAKKEDNETKKNPVTPVMTKTPSTVSNSAPAVSGDTDADDVRKSSNSYSAVNSPRLARRDADDARPGGDADDRRPNTNATTPRRDDDDDDR